MSGIDKATSYRGKNHFQPDYGAPTRANLNHGEKIVRNLDNRPTFEGAVKEMVDQYGAVPVFAMMLPFALAGIAHGSLGVGIDGSSMGHGHDILSGSHHMIDQDLENKQTASNIHIATDFGRADSADLLPTFSKDFGFARGILAIMQEKFPGLTPQNVDIKTIQVTGNGRIKHTPEVGMSGEQDALVDRVDQFSIVTDLAADRAYAVMGYDPTTQGLGGIRDINDAIATRKWAIVPLSTNDGHVFNWKAGQEQLFRVDPNGQMIFTINGHEYTCNKDGGVTLASVSPTQQAPTEVVIPSSETVTTQYGLNVEVVGPADENGMEKVNILPPEKYAGNTGAQEKWLAYFDAERLGFEPGATQWMKTKDGRVILVDKSDTSKMIAEWREIPWIGKAAVVWNAKNMVDSDGKNPLLNVCKNWELSRKGGTPKDNKAGVDFVNLLKGDVKNVTSGSNMMYGNGEYINGGHQGFKILSNNGMSAVLFRGLKSQTVLGEGFIFTHDLDNKPITIFVENMDWVVY